MSLTPAVCTQYIRSIQKALPCSRTEKKQITDALRGTVLTFMEDHPDATVDSLYLSFGTPEQYAKEYLSQLSTETLSHRKRKASLAVVFVAVICLVLIAALIVTLEFFIIDIIDWPTDPIPIYYR